jgi:hypothetical protein
MRIDHVLIGARDLPAAADRLRDEHGLASVDGGVHPEWGTGNRIFPLGDDYVELIGIVDEETAARSLLGSWLREQLADGDRPFAWCLVVDDLDATAARLGIEPVAGGRTKPDGTRLSWRLLGLAEAIAEPPLPFFIEWGDAVAHPGAEATDHASAATGIAWVEIGGDEARLAEWLGGAQLPVRVAAGEPGLRALALAAPGGEIVLR